MEERHFQRSLTHCPVVFIGSHTVGKGRVTDVSVLGCAVASTTLLRKGDYLAVKLVMPDENEAVVVSLAAVRWALGGKFGLKFMHIGSEERDRLRLLLEDNAHETVSLQ